MLLTARLVWAPYKRSTAHNSDMRCKVLLPCSIVGGRVSSPSWTRQPLTGPFICHETQRVSERLEGAWEVPGQGRKETLRVLHSIPQWSFVHPSETRVSAQTLRAQNPHCCSDITQFWNSFMAGEGGGVKRGTDISTRIFICSLVWDKLHYQSAADKPSNSCNEYIKLNCLSHKEHAISLF